MLPRQYPAHDVASGPVGERVEEGVGNAPLAGLDESLQGDGHPVAPRLEVVQFGGSVPVRRVQDLAERSQFEQPSDERC